MKGGVGGNQEIGLDPAGVCGATNGCFSPPPRRRLGMCSPLASLASTHICIERATVMRGWSPLIVFSSFSSSPAAPVRFPPEGAAKCDQPGNKWMGDSSVPETWSKSYLRSEMISTCREATQNRAQSLRAFSQLRPPLLLSPRFLPPALHRARSRSRSRSKQDNQTEEERGRGLRRGRGRTG